MYPTVNVYREFQVSREGGEEHPKSENNGTEKTEGKIFGRLAIQCKTIATTSETTHGEIRITICLRKNNLQIAQIIDEETNNKWLQHLMKIAN